MAYIGTKPGNQVVNSDQIADGAVGTNDIANGAVTPAKLSSGAPTWDTSGTVGIGTSVINGFYGSSNVSTRAVIAYDSSSTSVDAAPKGLVIRNDNTTTNNLSQLVFASLNTQGSPIAAASIYSINDARSTGFSTGSLGFGTVGGSGVISERMRIDSSGNLLVGTTGVAANGPANSGALGRAYFVSDRNTLVCKTNSPSGYEPIALVRNGNNGTVATFWQADNTGVGNISVTASSTAYNTTSDYRLKENIAPMTGALAKVAHLKPCTYTWKADGSSGQGFIAHELAEVVPDAVTGEKDAVDEDGNPKYQGIDTSFLVATLTAAIQELKAEVDSLKAQLSNKE